VVPLLNRPFLAYQLAWLRTHGITDVVLACSYRTGDVRAALGDGRALGVSLRLVVEETPLGTGGGLRHAGAGARGTLVVLNGDVLADADLSALRAFHIARGARVTIALVRVPDPRAYGLVEADPEGRLRRFREKPGPEEPLTTDTINAGVYLLEAALLERVPRGVVCSLEREVFPALIADGVPCHGWPLAGYWRDIGSPAAYLAAQRDLLHARVASPLAPPGTRRDGVWLAPGVVTAPSARLEAPAVVGAGVEVGADAWVGADSVIGDGTRLGAAARVAGAVLWERVEVGPRARLRDCVLADGVRVGEAAEVGPGAVLAAGTVVPPGARVGVAAAPSGAREAPPGA
jgi:NDP-sugar pyrophosphorylase family protein